MENQTKMNHNKLTSKKEIKRREKELDDFMEEAIKTWKAQGKN